jgi:hypothetical protein
VTPDRHAERVTQATNALAARLRGHIENPDVFAAEFIAALQQQGWKPWAPVTALPTPGRPAEPPKALLSEVRQQLREAARQSDPQDVA